MDSANVDTEGKEPSVTNCESDITNVDMTTRTDETREDIELNTKDESSTLYSEIMERLEYFFSDSNLSRDRFMKSEMANNDGWMSIDTLLLFNTIKRLTTNREDLAKSLELLGSSLIELNDEKTKIKRKEAFDFEKDRKEANERSVFVEGFPPQEERDVLIVERKAIVSKLEELGGGQVGFTLFKKSHLSNLYNGKVVVEFKNKECADNCIEKYRQSANFYHQVKNERKQEEINKEREGRGSKEDENDDTSTKTDQDQNKEAYTKIQDAILAVEDWKTLPIIDVPGPEGQRYRIMIKPYDTNHPYYDKPRGQSNKKRKWESSISSKEDDKAQKRQKMKEEKIADLHNTMLIIEDASKEAEFQSTKEVLRTIIGGNGVSFIEFNDDGQGMARFKGVEQREKILERLNEDGMLILKEGEGYFSTSSSTREETVNTEGEENVLSREPLKELRFRLPKDAEIDLEATKYCDRMELSDGFNNKKSNFKGKQYGGKLRSGKFNHRGKR